LRRSGYSRLRDADRLSGVPVRHVHDHPGSLVHQDHKLGRIPDGGGHRALGLEVVGRHRDVLVGYDHFEVIVDDHTGWPTSPTCPRERPQRHSGPLLDAAVWFADHGVRIERVLTDNGWAYTHGPRSVATLDTIGARHKRTRPHRPQTNGKAERFIKTLLAEWAYGQLYRTNDERLERLSPWVREYNTERTHTTLGGITPMEALVNNLHGNHT
jgi:transposase InsO family protein